MIKHHFAICEFLVLTDIHNAISYFLSYILGRIDDFIEGPKVQRSMYASCSDEYGSLGWAIDKCKERTSCNILNDAECDNANWRYCVGLDIADFSDTSEKSCSLIRAPKGEIILV